MSVRFRIAPDERGRVDKVIGRRYPAAGRRALARMFRAGRVRIDGAVAKKGDLVSDGAEVQLDFEPGADATVVAEDNPAVTCIYEDDDLVALNKLAGMASHPLAQGELGTAANVIVARYPECAGASDDPREAGLVHRLDTFTSGVLVAARNAEAWRAARQLFSDKAVDKTYLALVAGKVNEPGSCNEHLSRTGSHVSVVVQGLAARTDWQVVENFADYTLVRCTTHHGRRHQVRVHLAHAGHPIAGDSQYGGPTLVGLKGQFLHGDSVKLPHPVSGEELLLQAPLAPEQEALLESLRSA